MKTRLGLLIIGENETHRLRQALLDEGLACRFFSSPRTLLEALGQQRFDALLLDARAIGPNPAQFALQARVQASNEPLLILLAANNDAQAVTDALACGIDQCIARPLKPPVVVAQIAALLRRARDDAQRYAVHGTVPRFDYVFHRFNCTVSFLDTQVALTHKEFEIAQLLFRNVSRTIAREQLFEAVWGRTDAALSRTLDSHISKLRSKLALKGNQGYRLSTLYGHGYRLDRLSPGWPQAHTPRETRSRHNESEARTSRAIRLTPS